MIHIEITAKDLKTGRIEKFVYHLPEETIFNTGTIIENQGHLDDTKYAILEQEVRGS